MDERLTEKVLEYLKDAGDFVISEAPVIVQQTLKYELISTWTGMGINFLILVICLSFLYYFMFYPKYDKYESLAFGTMMGRLVTSYISAVVFVFLIKEMDKLIKLYTAPKLFLIQYFIGLGK